MAVMGMTADFKDNKVWDKLMLKKNNLNRKKKKSLKF